jgi:hypothetical protein
MAEQQISPYDQQTLDLLVAAGVEEALVRRVNRIAREVAAWKARAKEERQSPRK